MPFAFLFWKKNLNVFFAPMIITTPERKRICNDRESVIFQPVRAQFAGSSGPPLPHVSHCKQALVEEHEHAKHHKEQARGREANADLCDAWGTMLVAGAGVVTVLGARAHSYSRPCPCSRVEREDASSTRALAAGCLAQLWFSQPRGPTRPQISMP